MSFSGSYADGAQALGLDQLDPTEQPAPTSSYWAYLENDELGAAINDRWQRFRQWAASQGIYSAMKLKNHYYHCEYRAQGAGDMPHLSVMTQWGAAGEYSFVPVNFFRSLLKTLLSNVVQNPPGYTARATNSDAFSMEEAALYQSVLDYYSRELRIPSKISRAVEIAMVCDLAFISVEWDYFAINPDAPSDDSLWRGAPSVKNLNPWDVVFDVTKPSWSQVDWCITREWIDKERLKAQFPEHADAIDGCPLRGEVLAANNPYEVDTRYNLTQFMDISNDIQVLKLFYKKSPIMPQGRYCMALDNGTLLWESPAGLVYPELPVRVFMPDTQTDILWGYSPANDLVPLSEACNSIISAIQSNAANYGNQLVGIAAGTDINPKILGEGHKCIEVPSGLPFPQGINLTEIPPALYQHLDTMLKYMSELPAISASSRGQTGGANQTGSAMLFTASQSASNQGNMNAAFADFSADVLTALLHLLRVFAKNETTIQIMGESVASRTVVLGDALKNFDSVQVDLNNPILNTPQGRMGFAQQLLQFGSITPEQALQVATSGTIGPAIDPVREQQFALQLENEWLQQGQQNVLVSSLDNHEQHIQFHTRLLSIPWLRNPTLAAKLNIPNAPQVMQVIQGHILEHMKYLGGNMANSTTAQAPLQPGQQPHTSPSMGQHPPEPPPAGPGAPPQQQQPQGAAPQAGAAAANVTMPKPPSQPVPHQATG